MHAVSFFTSRGCLGSSQGPGITLGQNVRCERVAHVHQPPAIRCAHMKATQRVALNTDRDTDPQPPCSSLSVLPQRNKRTHRLDQGRLVKYVYGRSLSPLGRAQMVVACRHERTLIPPRAGDWVKNTPSLHVVFGRSRNRHPVFGITRSTSQSMD